MLFHHKHHYHRLSSSSSRYKWLVFPPNLAMTAEPPRQPSRFIITYDGTISPHQLTPTVHYGNRIICRHTIDVDNKQRLCQMFNRHLSVNDVPSAVRTVASDDILCDITQDALESLQSKHPPAPSNIEIIPIPTDIPSMTTSSQDIREAIRSFSGSSVGGVDGLRRIHLQDPVSNQTAEAGNRLILSLTSFVNTFLN